MARLKVLTVPDPQLRIKARPVDRVDAAVRRLMDDLVETVIAEDGAGLAATQVGIHKRVIVVDLSSRFEDIPMILMANPEIVWASSEKSEMNEGCLSVPDQRSIVERPAAVKVTYLDEHNNQQELNADGYLATCVQHEIDHLNGKLYIDYLPPLKRQLLIQKAKRFVRAEALQ
ncbi:MAG: peptide deformylase [Alphaproteobacteria bacterium]|nr:peptide deformylase [Alphaproteobacteria bacterium]